MMSHAGLNAIDTNGIPIVAHVSSAAVGSQRWTELTIWYRGDARRPYLAETFGATVVEGERNRRRRWRTKTLEEALAFFDNVHLARSLRAQARRWHATRADKVGPAPAARTPRS